MAMSNVNEPGDIKPLLQDIAEQLDIIGRQICENYCRYEHEVRATAVGLSAEEEDALNYELWEAHCQICPMIRLWRE